MVSKTYNEGFSDRNLIVKYRMLLAHGSARSRSFEACAREMWRRGLLGD